MLVHFIFEMSDFDQSLKIFQIDFKMDLKYVFIKRKKKEETKPPPSLPLGLKA